MIILAKILIIDDESVITMILKEILCDAEHEVLTANNGLSALKMLEQFLKPDLIMVDLLMPGMGGCDFIERINADPKFKGIPVILITGFVPSIEDLPPSGSYQDIICKPFDIDDVVMKVNKLLDSKQNIGIA